MANGKTKTYKVTITDVERWTGVVEARSKSEAMDKAMDYVIGGSDAWDVVKTT